MKTFKLTVSTPQGNLFEREITMLSLYGTEGSLAVMANHIPFITTTKAGEVKISTEEEELLADATGGILTVTHEGTTLLCTEFNIK
jgi:F0F1-type ATP synthase epsilon subunit